MPYIILSSYNISADRYIHSSQLLKEKSTFIDRLGQTGSRAAWRLTWSTMSCQCLYWRSGMATGKAGARLSGNSLMAVLRSWLGVTLCQAIIAYVIVYLVSTFIRGVWNWLGLNIDRMFGLCLNYKDLINPMGTSLARIELVMRPAQVGVHFCSWCHLYFIVFNYRFFTLRFHCFFLLSLLLLSQGTVHMGRSLPHTAIFRPLQT